MRLNKTGESNLHGSAPNLSGNEPLKIFAGTEKLVLGTGAIVQESVKVAKEKGWELWSFPIISSMGKKWITEDLLRFKEIITIEEHQLNSGFGSAVLEVMNDAYISGKLRKYPNIRRVGIPNIFLGYSGSQEYLRNEAKLSLLL